MPEIFSILIIVFMIIFLWTLVGIVSLAKYIRNKTNQAALVAIGYYLINRLKK